MMNMNVTRHNSRSTNRSFERKYLNKAEPDTFKKRSKVYTKYRVRNSRYYGMFFFRDNIVHLGLNRPKIRASYLL